VKEGMPCEMMGFVRFRFVGRNEEGKRKVVRVESIRRQDCGLSSRRWSMPSEKQMMRREGKNGCGRGDEMINTPERAKRAEAVLSLLGHPTSRTRRMECSSLVLSLHILQPNPISPALCPNPPPQLEKVRQMRSLQKIQRHFARSHSQTMNYGPTQACETQTATAVSFPAPIEKES